MGRHIRTGPLGRVLFYARGRSGETGLQADGRPVREQGKKSSLLDWITDVHMKQLGRADGRPVRLPRDAESGAYFYFLEGGFRMNRTNETMEPVLESTERVNHAVHVKVKQIAFVGLMGAMSTVLMLFRFPLPFLPPFLSFDLSGVMEIMGGYMFGPVAAFFVILVKLLLQMIVQGSNSFGTGEIQGLILSCAYVMPSVALYHWKKSKKTAVAGMALSTVVVSVTAVFTNLYMIIPFYATMAGMTMNDIVAMCTAVNPAVNSAATMVLWGILPFNLIKYGATSIVTFFVYKRLSKVIRGIINQ